ncbi:MAG: HEWD family protein [Halobacteriaceae archaeon]
MSAEIRTPSERECDLCGRKETWDAGEENWRVEDGEVGDVYCLHSWDITGRFTPVER